VRSAAVHWVALSGMAGNPVSAKRGKQAAANFLSFAQTKFTAIQGYRHAAAVVFSTC